MQHYYLSALSPFLLKQTNVAWDDILTCEADMAFSRHGVWRHSCCCRLPSIFVHIFQFLSSPIHCACNLYHYRAKKGEMDAENLSSLNNAKERPFYLCLVFWPHFNASLISLFLCSHVNLSPHAPPKLFPIPSFTSHHGLFPSLCFRALPGPSPRVARPSGCSSSCRGREWPSPSGSPLVQHNGHKVRGNCRKSETQKAFGSSHECQRPQALERAPPLDLMRRDTQRSCFMNRMPMF